MVGLVSRELSRRSPETAGRLPSLALAEPLTLPLSDEAPEVDCVKVQREALAESSVVFGRVFGNRVGRRLTV